MGRWPVVMGGVLGVLLVCLGVAYAVGKQTPPPAPQVVLADPALAQALNRLAAAKEAEVVQMARQNEALEASNRLQEQRNQREGEQANSLQNVASALTNQNRLREDRNQHEQERNRALNNVANGLNNLSGLRTLEVKVRER